MYSFIARKVIFPTYSFLRRSDYYKYYKFLKKTEWWSREELIKLQTKKFRNLIKHSYASVPFYKRYFKENNLSITDFQIMSDIVKLPIITKDQIRSNLKDFTSVINDKRIFLATGGSTGEPFKFYFSANASSKGGAAELRGREYMGYKLGEKLLWIWGSYFDLKEFNKFQARVLRKFRRTKIVDALKISEESIAEYIQLIRRFKPKAIFGYTSSIFSIANHILKNDLELLNVPILINGAETLYPHWKNTVESAFNGTFYNHYATRESTIVSDECVYREGCHISIENGQIEIIKNNQPVFDERGKITVTDFNNYSMPIIRYEIGDVGTITESSCSCGRSHPLLKEIEGRISDFIVSKTGTVYNPLSFMWLFYEDPYNWDPNSFLSLERYQVIQETLDKIIINIVPTKQYTKIIKEKILRNFRNLVQDDFEIEINLVEEIPETQSGKRRYVVSKIKDLGF
ncbi:MAG: phenylacetate--CoA ligase family protein [Candidatus Heimdallarchaeota archaeon]